jgi:putative heme iron utilization protein
MSNARDARRLLRARCHGFLCTVSKRISGYPFGSVVRFLNDPSGRPIILISRLAEHTKNIAADARVSLLAHKPGADVQAQARVTLIGDAAPVAPADASSLARRYLRYFPDARRLLALGDFDFYRIEPLAVRYIAGFGSIHWIAKESFTLADTSSEHQEDAILVCLNSQHAHKLQALCRHHGTSDAQVIGLDCDGCDIRADGAIVRLDFPEVVADLPAAQAAVLAMLAVDSA